MLELNKIYEGDCLQVMQEIDDHSIDFILCDLPYGATTCKWDVQIDMQKLWDAYKRIITERGVIALFGTEPFASKLRMSNLEMYKYDWYWNKNSSGGFVHAKVRPMTTMETISIFSNGNTCSTSSSNMIYNPQGLKPYGKITRRGNKQEMENTYWRPSTSDNQNYQEFTNYPKNYLEFSIVSSKDSMHPTQKPVDLCEYLIKTYTHAGMLVLDNCCGTGTTCVASNRTGRNFIGIEFEHKYAEISKERLRNATMQKLETLNACNPQ